MPVTFPAIRCPGTRVLTPGTYPLRDFVATNGAVTKILRGDRMTDFRLTLSYPYMLDAQAATVWQTWIDSLGGFDSVTLPSNAFEGLGSALVATIPTYLQWFMASPPEVQSVQARPGYNSVRIDFIGQLAA